MSEPALFRYFCTAGNGMERFLVEEVKTKLGAEDVCQMPGKVLFSSFAPIVRVSELKGAERLFLLLKQDSPVILSAHTKPAKAASVLESKLLGSLNEWTSTVMTWSRMQGELAGRRTAVNIPNTSPRGRRKGDKDRESGELGKEKEKCDEEFRINTGGKREEETENGKLRNEVQREGGTSKESCGAVEPQTQEKKRKRGDEEEDSGDKNVEKQRISEREITREDDSCVKKGKKRVISETDWYGRGLDYCAVENVEHVKTTRGGDETQLQPNSNKPESLLAASTVPVSFRISCKCTGSLSRYLSVQEVSRVIGAALSRLLGWKADLRNPQMEVNVYLSDDYYLLGIPLTRLPLANRSYIKTTGLRSTVAWAMASLAQIKSGFCVVDPMCGVGTILIEAAQEHKDVCFLGMDIDDGQLQKANENIVFAELGNRIHLLKASSMVLPLPSSSVDAVICDLPFGRKFGSKSNMAANLPLILTEMERVLCFGGTLVLLLSPQLSCLLKKLLAQTDTGSTSNQETEPQTGIQDCSFSLLTSTKQQTFQSSQGVKSSSTQETDCQNGPQRSQRPSLSSLKHQATVRVSLGAIDGLIHKYIKTDI